MYDDLDDREEALAQARSDRAKSTRSSPSSSGLGSQEADGGMTRAVSLDTGLSENTKKKPSIVWKTAYESADAKEELGRQLDEQAAEAEARGKQDPVESDSDEEDARSGSSLFKAQGDDVEEEPETSRNSVFRFWNDASSDEEDDTPTQKLNPLFQRMGDEDSDDEISEDDIGPDSASSPIAGPCEGTSDDDVESETSEGEESEEDKEEEEEEEEDDGDENEEDEGEEEEEEEEEEEHGLGVAEDDQIKVVPEVKPIEEEVAVAATPKPFARPTAKSFLSMFFNPAAFKAPDSDLIEEKKEVIQLTPKQSEEPVVSAGERKEEEPVSAEPTAQLLPLTASSGDLELTRSSTLEEKLRPADINGNTGNDGAQPCHSQPHTFNQDQGSGLDDDHSSDEQCMEDEGCHAEVSLSPTCSTVDPGNGGHVSEKEAGLGDKDGVDAQMSGDGDTLHNSDHNDSNEPDNGTNDNDETIKDKNNESHNGDTDTTNRNGDHRSEDHPDSDDDVGPELDLDMTQPDWDINLSDAYKEKYPNGKYILRWGSPKPNLDWDTDYLPDEWTEGTDWYQGGPDRDPRDIRWKCPLTHNLGYYEGPRQVIKFIEPTNFRPEVYAEANPFYDGRMDMAVHAKYLEKELQGIENWRRNEYRKDLVINWRVRTGQQTPICGGWWFIEPGCPWWLLDWSKKGRRYHEDDE